MMKLSIFFVGLLCLHLSLAENSYLVVLPKLFKVNYENEFSVFCMKPVEISLDFTLGQQRVQKRIQCKEGETRDYTFPLPKQFPIGIGELTITGMGDIEFMEKREVIVYDDRHMLMVQTSSSSYRPGDTIELRVICTSENLMPMESGEVTVEIFDSQFKLVTEFKKLPIRNGLCEIVRYQLPIENLKFGTWMISATMENTTSSVEITIGRPEVVSFDVKVLFPRFFLRLEKLFRGIIEISDDCDRPIFGRATMAIGQITEADLAAGDKTKRVVPDSKQMHEEWMRDWKTQTFEFGGRYPFSYDLTTMFGIDLNKALALTVFVDVVDLRTGEHRAVRQIVPIFNRDVIYDIRPLDFEAGQKCEYEIIAKRPDGKPVKMEEVLVNVTMMFPSEEPRVMEIKDLYTRGRTDIGMFAIDIPKDCIGVILTLTPIGSDGKRSGYRTQALPLMPMPRQRDTTGAKLTIEMMPDEEMRPTMMMTEPVVSTMVATVGKKTEFYVQLLPTKSMERHETPIPMRYILLTNSRITDSGMFYVEPTKYCQEKMGTRTIRPEDPSMPPQCVYNATLTLMMTREMVPYSTLLVYAFNSTYGFNVAESYRFSVWGLFQNNLTLNMTEMKVDVDTDFDPSIPRDVKISPKAKNLWRMDLTMSGLPESTVGVNVLTYDSINEGLPNDITKERLLRYMTGYEYVPLPAMPTGSMKSEDEHVVSTRTHEGRPHVSEEEMKRQFEGYKIRYLFEKLAFGLRSGHRLRPVDGDDAYVPTNMDHLYGERRPERLRDYFHTKSNNRNRQYNINVDKNDYVVAVGMPHMPMPPTEMHEEHSSETSDEEPEEQTEYRRHEFEYGSPQWYRRMDTRMSLFSKEAFIFMQCGLSVVSDFTILNVPRELLNLNITSTIRTFRLQSMMQDQDSYSYRQNARQMFMKYMSETPYQPPPPMMYDEESRTTYHRSLMFNTTRLDSKGEAKFRLPRTSYPFTTWLATGFSLNSKYGFGVAQPLRLSSRQGLYVMCSSIPMTRKVVQIGERVPFSFIISNYFMKDLQNVMFRIRASPDFDIMEGEKVIKMDKEYMMTIPMMKSETSETRQMFFVPKRAGPITMIMEVESEMGGDYEIVSMTCGDKTIMEKPQTCVHEWKWW